MQFNPDPTPALEGIPVTVPSLNGHEAATGTATPAQRKAADPGRLRSMLMRVAGVDGVMVARLPSDEQNRLAMIGAAMLAGSTFQALCISLGLGVILPDDTAHWPLRVLIVIVLTTVLHVLDRSMVANDWVIQGREAIERGPSRHWERCQRWLNLAIRLSFSAGSAYVWAQLVLLHPFDDDIRKLLAQQNASDNSAIVQEATESVQARLADLKAAIDREGDAIADLQAKQGDLLRLDMTALSLQSQLDGLRPQASRLLEEKNGFEQRAHEFEAMAAAEEGGYDLKRNTTVKSGCGQRCKALKAEQENNARLAKQRADDWQRIQDEITRIQEAMQQARTQPAALDPRLADIGKQLEARQAARNELIRKRDELTAGEAATIKSLATGNPAYMPPDDGLIARLNALDKLRRTGNGSTYFMLAAELFIVLMEMAGPIAKSVFLTTGIYQVLIGARNARVQSREIAAYRLSLIDGNQTAGTEPADGSSGKRRRGSTKAQPTGAGHAASTDSAEAAVAADQNGGAARKPLCDDCAFRHGRRAT
jgi:hypothetical protein